MEQDFRTKIGNQVFGVRATALIIREGKILLTKDSHHTYYTIGGAIQVGENTEIAVKREVREELGIDVLVKDLAFIVENQFCQDGVKFHNIEFHYLVEPLSEHPLHMLEDGKAQVCEWLNLHNLSQYDIVPGFLKEELFHYLNNEPHIVHKISY